jgi:RIO kinase 1
VHIPRTLQGISQKQFERDASLAAQGRGDELIFGGGVVGAGPLAAAVAGLDVDGRARADAAAGSDGADSDGDSEADSADEDEDGLEGDDDESRERARMRRALHRNEDPEARRERKKLVKEAQRQARATKIPKHVKRNPTAKAKSKEKTQKAGKKQQHDQLMAH